MKLTLSSLRLFIHENTPIILFSIFFITTIIVNNQFYVEDQSEIKHGTEIVSELVANEIENQLNQRIELIEIFENEWVSVSNESLLFSNYRFETRVPYFYNLYPGYLAINWINSSGVIKYVYPYEPNTAAINRSIVYLMSGSLNVAFNVAQNEGVVGMTNVTALFQGGMGFATYHPLIYYNSTSQKNETVGYFNTVFQINPLIENIISNTPILEDYSFSLKEYDQEVYHYNENFSLDSKYTFSNQISFYGRTWNLNLSPNQGIIRNNSYFSRWSILLLGILGSIITLYMSYSILQKSRALEQSYKEKDEVEQRLFQAQKMESLGTLAGGIAHDFNNVLMGLQGNILLLQDEQIQDIQKISSNDTLYNAYPETFDEVEKLIERAKEMTAQILLFSRQTDYNFESFNLNSTIQNTIGIFSKTIDKRIKIETNLSSAPIFILGNTTKIHQIITNLLVNARDALPYGGSITIDLFLQDRVNIKFLKGDIYDDKIEAKIIIKDNGIGIKPELIQHIFDPYFTTKEVGKGTGLGLSIVYRAVHSMNGYIEVQSQEKKGTSFLIYFPVLKDKIIAPTSIESKISLNFAKITPIFHDIEVLIVEDEPTISNPLAKFLTHRNIKSNIINNGDEAILHYRRNRKRYQLVILDINIPGLSGIEIYQQIKLMRPIPKIIFITGFSDNTIPDLALENVEMLQKPFKFEQIEEKLKKFFP